MFTVVVLHTFVFYTLLAKIICVVNKSRAKIRETVSCACAIYYKLTLRVFGSAELITILRKSKSVHLHLLTLV